MSGTVGMSTLFLSSPLKLEEEAKLIEKQGIVLILGSDTVQQQHTKRTASLRRTLSADMSSKKWLTQHGLIISPMKKIGSSQQIAVADSLLSSSEEEEEKEEFERPGGQARVWRRSIQSKSQKEEELGKSGQVDIWGQILSQKANEDKSMLPPPYIHPLVKRSASSLSSKSLEVCTESLGSETGSDGFSSYASSETGDIEEDKVLEEEEEEEVQQQQEKESQYLFEREELGLGVAKHNNFYSTTTGTSTSNKKLSSFNNSSFPPPLPSLARRDGPSLHVQSHRENGRLVLEAVSTPSNNNFHAHRQDGRLILKFATVGPSEEEIIDQHQQDQEEDEAEEIEQNLEEEEKYYEAEEEDEEITQVYDESEDDDEEEEVLVVVQEKVNENKNEAKANKEEIGIVMEQQAPKLSSGAINVHRSALMMKKLMGLDNMNPTWTTKKFNEAVNLVEMEEEEEEEEGPTLAPLAQSLPRPPHLIPSPPATAASFNAYEYFWRTKPTVATLIHNNNPMTTQQCRPPLKNNCSKVFLSKSHEQQEMVLLRRNKEDNLVPLFRGCKETRRSLLIWEPCTIASS